MSEKKGVNNEPRLGSIVEKLARIQSALAVGKGQFNSYGGYKYRSCEDIVEAVKPLVHAEGLALVITDDIVSIADRVYIKAIAKLLDPQGMELSVSAFAREEETKKGMDASQITGSTSSYSRKYALCGLFAIDDSKDSDSTNTHGRGNAAVTDKPSDVSPPESKVKLSAAEQDEILSKATEYLISAANKEDALKRTLGKYEGQLTKQRVDKLRSVAGFVDKIGG